MRRHNVLLICLLLTLPMLAGCTGNANGAGEADPESVTVVNNYYNNTTNQYTTTADGLPPLQILHTINGTPPLTIDAGEIVEVVKVWYGSDSYHSDYNGATKANVSCLTPGPGSWDLANEHYLSYIGEYGETDYSGVYSNSWTDFLPTSGEACSYTFYGGDIPYGGGTTDINENIFIIYRVHDLG